MMQVKRWLGIGVLGLAVVMSGATLQTWAGQAGSGDGPGKMEKMAPHGAGHDADDDGDMGGRRLIAELNLSEEQIAKLKSERSTTQKKMNVDLAEMKNLHLDLDEAISSEKPDMEKVEKLIKQISGVQEQLMFGRIKSFMFLRSILTPEQKRKMDAIHMQMGPGDGGFFKGMHGQRNRSCDKKGGK